MSVEPEKWGVIYNPKAGTRKVQKRWKEIKEYMDSKGVSYDYVQSEGFGSVERLAGILANNGYRTIVIVGGDGALNDAVNGIMLSNAENKEEIAIGIIPNGIGNDFADYWEMSSEYKKAVDCIINNRRRKIDVGTCYYYDGEKHLTRYFLNAINIGLGARIVKITDQCKRFWGVKFLSYFMALLSIIFERKLYRMHLKINGEHIRNCIWERVFLCEGLAGSGKVWKDTVYDMCSLSGYGRLAFLLGRISTIDAPDTCNWNLPYVTERLSKRSICKRLRKNQGRTDIPVSFTICI